ncbi:MAG TPA: hypothetical protein VFT57_05925 [Gemmatimonadaceae bacterium]|nr:hypothetical protein [Gemmatimonadaceae bacterium]
MPRGVAWREGVNHRRVTAVAVSAAQRTDGGGGRDSALYASTKSTATYRSSDAVAGVALASFGGG